MLKSFRQNFTILSFVSWAFYGTQPYLLGNYRVPIRMDSHFCYGLGKSMCKKYICICYILYIVHYIHMYSRIYHISASLMYAGQRFPHAVDNLPIQFNTLCTALIYMYIIANKNHQQYILFALLFPYDVPFGLSFLLF